MGIWRNASDTLSRWIVEDGKDPFIYKILPHLDYDALFRGLGATCRHWYTYIAKIYRTKASKDRLERVWKALLDASLSGQANNYYRSYEIVSSLGICNGASLIKVQLPYALSDATSYSFSCVARPTHPQNNYISAEVTPYSILTDNGCSIIWCVQAPNGRRRILKFVVDMQTGNIHPIIFCGTPKIRDDMSHSTWHSVLHYYTPLRNTTRMCIIDAHYVMQKPIANIFTATDEDYHRMFTGRGLISRVYLRKFK